MTLRRLTLLPLLAVAGCLSTAGEGEVLPAPPGASFQVERFLGTGLTGPLPVLPEPDLASEGGLVRLRFELIHLEHLPRLELDSLALSSRFIANPGRRVPLKPASILASGALIVQGEQVGGVREVLESGAAGRRAVLLERSILLPVGVTGVLVGTGTGIFAEEVHPWRPDPEVQVIPESFSLFVSREAGQESLGLLADLRGPMRRLDYRLDREESYEPQPALTINERSAGRPKWGPLQAEEEIVLPQARLRVDGGPIVFLGDSPFDRVNRRGLALFVEASSEVGELEPRELEGLQAELQAEAEAALRLVSPEESALSRNRTLVRALDQLTADSVGRRTLAVLAQVIGAQLCNDFALVADEQLFARFVEELDDQTEEILATTGKQSLAWRLEREAYTLLAGLDPDDELTAELAGVLLRRAGQVGRYPGSIDEAILVSADLEQFMRFLRDENTVFLEDSDPSSRVRAFDWLLEQGVRIEGFEPLAPAKERRAALSRYYDRLEGQGAEEAAEGRP